MTEQTHFLEIGKPPLPADVRRGWPSNALAHRGRDHKKKG